MAPIAFELPITQLPTVEVFGVGWSFLTLEGLHFLLHHIAQYMKHIVIAVGTREYDYAEFHI